MTKHQLVHGQHAPDPMPDLPPGGWAEEAAAIHAGVVAGDEALARLGSSGVLLLFADDRHADIGAPKLQALRTYAELKRALLKQGRDIPASSLAGAGYTAAEAARFDAIIASAPSSNVLQFGTRLHATRTETDRWTEKLCKTD